MTTSLEAHFILFAVVGSQESSTVADPVQIQYIDRYDIISQHILFIVIDVQSVLDFSSSIILHGYLINDVSFLSLHDTTTIMTSNSSLSSSFQQHIYDVTSWFTRIQLLQYPFFRVL